MQKITKKFGQFKKKQYFCTRFPEMEPGAIAQLVEQRTENPCVPSSILGGTTKKRPQGLFFAFCMYASNLLAANAIEITPDKIANYDTSVIGKERTKRNI